MYRSSSKTGAYTRIATITSLKYSDSKADKNKTNYYKVKAVNRTAISGLSAYVGVYHSSKFAWPVPGYTSISSGYGKRICPYHGEEYHTGIDISTQKKTPPVVAARDGTVILSGWNGSYGNCIILDHGNGLYTLYGHNSSLAVKKGNKVKRGQKIANVGSTGNSTGEHCHFEVRTPKSSSGNDVNPWPYLK